MNNKFLLTVLLFILICFPLYTKASISNEIIISTNKQTMDLDDNNYKSDLISIKNNDLSSYRVKVISGGSNYIIIDSYGKERNTFSIDESFMVISKEESVNKEEDIVLRIESTINNDILYGNIKLHVNWNKRERHVTIKTIDSETKKMINGSIYLIYDNNNSLIDEVITTNYFAYTSLPYGEYRIIEKETLNGYKKSDLEKKIIIDNNSPSNINIEFLNDPLKSVSIATISKVDNSIISGATLILRDSENNIISTFKTSSDRTIISDLYYGTYTISEESSPVGYYNLSSPTTFTIDGKSNSLIDINVSYTPYNGVRIVNYDSTKNYEGTEFEIINSDGEVVKTVTSLNDSIIIDDLESGVYTLREVNGPTGDVAFDNFEVSDDELTTIYVVKHDASVSLNGPSKAYYIASIILGAIGYLAIYIAKKRFN